MSIQHTGSQASLTLSVTPRRKRKLGETEFDEVADSEDEDYGWDDEDTLPSMPPQWQGSEDLLIGQTDADGNRAESEEPAHEAADDGASDDNEEALNS